jgi:hypothetical protein
VVDDHLRLLADAWVHSHSTWLCHKRVSTPEASPLQTQRTAA